MPSRALLPTALLLVVAVFPCVLPGATGRAADAPPDPAELDAAAKDGRIDDALDGWEERYLSVDLDATARRAALVRLRKLAPEVDAPAVDGWLELAVRSSDAPLEIAAGRRVIVLLTRAERGEVELDDIGRVADELALIAERITGSRPEPVLWERDGAPPIDSHDRIVVVVRVNGTDDLRGKGHTWMEPPRDEWTATGLARPLAAVLLGDALGGVANRPVARMGGGFLVAASDIAIRERGVKAELDLLTEERKEGQERFDDEWAVGCLPSAWLQAPDQLGHLLLQAFAAALREAGSSADRVALVRHLLDTALEPPPSGGELGEIVATGHEHGVVALAAGLPASSYRVLALAGYAPSADDLEDLRARVGASRDRAEAYSMMRAGAQSSASVVFDAAERALLPGAVRDHLRLERLHVGLPDTLKAAKKGLRDLRLVTDFDYLGPMPQWDRRGRGGWRPASPLLALGLALADGRRKLDEKEPVAVSLKWKALETPKDALLPMSAAQGRRRWWRGSGVAAHTVKKPFGDWVRLVPYHSSNRGTPRLGVGGRLLDAWSDGSYLTRIAKGTELTIVSAGTVSGTLLTEDASAEIEELAELSGPAAIGRLRPWAARALQPALPVITRVLVAADDATLLREMRLLAPYLGGDASTAQALIERTTGKPAPLAAYASVCRGTRNDAVIDLLLAAAPEQGPALESIAEVVGAALLKPAPGSRAAAVQLWTDGRAWVAQTASIEAEHGRDPGKTTPGFTVRPWSEAAGRACLARAPEDDDGTAIASTELAKSISKGRLYVRWMSEGGRLELTGTVVSGKRKERFELMAADDGSGRWQVQDVGVGKINKGRVWVILDDPCKTDYLIDQLVLGPAQR